MEKYKGQKSKIIGKRRKYRLCLAFLLCLVVFMAEFSLPMNSRAEGKQKVRVGYVTSEEFIRYHEVPGQSHYDGYMAEFLEVLSIYGDWEYEFVNGNWEECKQWIADGTIDLLPGAMLEDASETVSLSELPLTTIWDNIYVPAEMGASFREYEVLQNMKIGYLKGGYTNEDFFQRHDLKCELIPFDSFKEMDEALDNGTVDATMGIESAASDSNRTLLARVHPRCIYMGFSNHNPELKEEMVRAYEHLMMEMPTLLETLKSKYVEKQEANSVMLSQVEKDWIAEHPTVTVAYIKNRTPHEYEDENGEAKGIHVEFLEEVLKLVGLEAEWISVDNTEQALSYLDKGLVDVVTTVCSNDELVESGDVLVTAPYRDSFFSVLGKKGVNLNNTVKPLTFVVEKGHRTYMDFIKKYYPNSKIIRKNTEEEVYAAIRSGEAKATVTEANTDEFFRLKYDISLENRVEQYQGIPVCFGVKESGSGQILVSILNQGIQNLDTNKANAIIVNNNSDLDLDYSFIMIVKKYWVIITVSTAVILLFALTIGLSRHKYQKERLWRASYTDKVTGKGNYEKLLLDTEHLFDGEHQGQYAVCALDIAKFKNLNETYGYNVGNKVLELMGQNIAAECKEGEYFARIGGDQFVMILKGSVTNEHVKRMEELIRQIEREISKLNSEYRVRCVAGVYLLQDDKDPYYAIDKANWARKAVKGSRGRNVAVYDLMMHKRMMKEREIESVMYQALLNEEFLVYLQPRVKIETGEIVAAEALVRWQRADGEMIYPDTFIPLFESNGFIREMDFYIYEQVCKMLRERMEKQIPVVPISVNVSRAHLETGDFIGSLNDLMNKYEIPREYVELELTESLLVENPTQMIEKANELKENHYTLSIDDFGSGYSSLNILKQLQFDVLKIDKEFLRTEGSKPEDKIILESVIHMAKGLKMQVLVEGVEVKEQQQMLTQMGCDFAQGYYFSRPIPMKDFLVLLEEQERQKGNLQSSQ